MDGFGIILLRIPDRGHRCIDFGPGDLPDRFGHATPPMKSLRHARAPSWLPRMPSNIQTSKNRALCGTRFSEFSVVR
jgi:hypothetical protein